MHKIWEILLWEQEGIKSWNFRTIPNVVAYILKNPVNSYDSNGVIAVPISTLRDEKRNLPIFCLPIFPRNPLNILGHIIRRWKEIFKENTTLLESWETVQNWRRNSGNQFYEYKLWGEMKSGTLTKPSGSLCDDEQLFWMSLGILGWGGMSISIGTYSRSTKKARSL